jgi:hypothetical protein
MVYSRKVLARNQEEHGPSEDDDSVSMYDTLASCKEAFA